MACSLVSAAAAGTVSPEWARDVHSAITRRLIGAWAGGASGRDWCVHRNFLAKGEIAWFDAHIKSCFGDLVGFGLARAFGVWGLTPLELLELAP